jgi:type I restriction enzyme S subunit
MSVTPDTAAPTGRNKPAQGKERSDAALGHASQNPSSPEGAMQGGSSSRLVPLDKVARHHSGNSKLIKGKLHDAPADNLFPAFSATGQDVWRDAFDREGDAIIISAVGARCGKCFLARGRWSAIANTHVVWPDPEMADIKFLWYLLNDEQFWIRSGSAQPFVAVRKTFEKEIFVPPLPEQRRIVAEIEKQFTRLEAGVAALRRVQANLKRYRAAVLKAACEGRLVPTEAALQSGSGVPPLGSGKKRQDAASTFETGETLLARILTERRQNWQGRGKYKEPAAPKTADLPALPGGWTWANGEQLFSWSSGEGLTQKDIQEGQYPVYGGNGVTGYHNAFVAEIPTLVIGRVGALCGNVYLTDGAAWITDNAIYAIQTPSCVAMRFIRLAFTRAELNKRATGSGQPFVNQRMLNETVIPLPPLAEQTRIVAEVERRLSVVEELESVVTANLQRATRLRQSILQRAFCGKLLSNDCHADKTNP